MSKYTKHTFSLAFCLSLLAGCGDGGNQIVEQPDQAKLEAKKQEFADFQKQMANQSKLPGKK